MLDYPDCFCVCFSLKMVKFELNQFIDQPSVEVLETCQKIFLFLVAQHYEISISRTLCKDELRACLMASLITKGVLPSETVPAAELAAPAAGS